MIAIPHYEGYGGLGDIPISQVIGGSVTTGLSTAVVATGGAILPLDIAAGASALITGLLGAFGVGVPDLKKIQSTHVVDQLEPYLKQNLAWWNDPTTSHSIANQQQGIAVFNAVWNQVVAGCSDPNLGSAGQNCIGDRQRGGKWDWFRLYLDPIANSPTVDSGTLSGDANGVVGSVSSSLGISSGTLLLLVGAVLLMIGMKEV